MSRYTNFLIAPPSLAALMALASASGCSNRANDCKFNLECGASTEPLPECEALPDADSSVIRDECGVFVRAASGPMGGGERDGTRRAPVTTLKEAIDIAKRGRMRVYACAEELAEAILVPDGMTVYGGLDCDSWALSDKLTSLTAAAGQIPLKLMKGEKLTRIRGLAVRAGAAQAASGSSIAVLVDDVEAEIIASSFTASSAMNGADGPPMPAPQAPPMTMNGKAGSAFGAEMYFGGEPGTNHCGGQRTNGGMGGLGGIPTFGPNKKFLKNEAPLDGAPGGPIEIGGAGGSPIHSNISCQPVNEGKSGGDGSSAASGKGGSGIEGWPAGALSRDIGYFGSNGGAGPDGSPGGGGGGGGGRQALNTPPAHLDDKVGASGGGGGAGGCGGKGGKGGGAGGSSIALILMGSKPLRLTDVELNAGEGGDGGKGGPGQVGATGGKGGQGGQGGDFEADDSTKGCRGGDGGSGGAGGRGGGGAGGHSLGIASVFVTANFVQFDRVRYTTSIPGLGGEGDTAESSGADGQSADVLRLRQQ